MLVPRCIPKIVPPGIQLLSALYSVTGSGTFGLKMEKVRTLKLTWGFVHAGTCNTPWSTIPAGANSSYRVYNIFGSISSSGAEPGLGAGFIIDFKKFCRLSTLRLLLTNACTEPPALPHALLKALVALVFAKLAMLEFTSGELRHPEVRAPAGKRSAIQGEIERLGDTEIEIVG